MHTLETGVEGDTLRTGAYGEFTEEMMVQPIDEGLAPLPYAHERMSGVNPEHAIGMLACTQRGTEVDDNDSGIATKSDDYVAFSEVPFPFSGDAVSLS